jgi:LuxR family maltose regulon positive regulatory protein
VAVIRLQAENYRETGSFAGMSGMDSLIETAIWNRISEQDREFLMSVSLLDAFTPRQAAIILDTPSLPQRAEDLLRQNAFIPYSGERGVYYMHTILRDFLRQRFESAPAGFRSETLRRAGRACEAVREYYEAARFFNEVRDYDAIFSMPLTNQYFYNTERKVIEFFGQLLDECGDEILLKYPITLLTVGNQFLKNGMRDRFSRAAGLLRKLTGEPSGLSERELTRVKGEFELMMFFTQFNDIAKMSECHRRAHAHLKQLSDPPRSIIFSGAMPSWTLGITSVLCLYWRKSGELEKTLSIMDKCLPIYTGLAGGHGAGAEYVMRAEASLNRGSDAEAEAMCQKALYEARSARQFGNCLCAELVLARIALLRGDGKAYDAARQSIARDAKEARQAATTRMGELCLALLDMSLGRTSDIPDWLRDIEGIRNVLYVPGQPYALMIHGKFLLLEKRHTELYGITELVTDITRKMNYLLPLVYQSIYLAAAKHQDGFGEEAEGHLREALDTALPDKVYLPFAENASFILPVLENMKKGFEPGAKDALIALCRRRMSGADAVRKAPSSEKHALTPRQREIALLTKGGLSAKEIASELFVTENTVKSAIKVIYGKLDIHSKTDLRKIEL